MNRVYSQSQYIYNVATQFFFSNSIDNIYKISKGNINDTYVVNLSDENSRQSQKILQRINTKVFTRPNLLMRNMDLILKHLHTRLKEFDCLTEERRWEFPEINKTIANSNLFLEFEGDYWRSIDFISSSKSIEIATKSSQAYETGFAVGFFHQLLMDFDPNQIISPINDFHNLKSYLFDYDLCLESSGNLLDSQAHFIRCEKIIGFISSRRNEIENIYNLISKNSNKYVVHGDPKINNILFDINSEMAISLIDLDTVSSGYLQFDIGDSLRSLCNKEGEDSTNVREVSFDLGFFEQFLVAYTQSSYMSLSDSKLQFLPESIKLLSFELGIRFFLDYLQGNKYFKITYNSQNLVRSEIQFALLLDIESKWNKILKITNSLL